MTDSPKGPIFIVSAMRSGSTLLRLILDAHPNIAIGPESGFMRAVRSIKNAEGLPDGENWFRGWGISDERMNVLIANFYSSVFSEYATAAGKPRWGEKTPFHVYHLAHMMELFPDAQFIGIIRHPGAVVASHLRWGYEFDKALTAWKSTTTRILGMAADHPDRVAAVRFEDLVLAPETTLRDLLDWLSEPWDDAVLQHGAAHRDKQTPRKVEGGTDSHQEIDATRVTAWVRSLPADQIERLGSIGRAMDAAGYAHDQAQPVGALRPELINRRRRA